MAQDSTFDLHCLEDDELDEEQVILFSDDDKYAQHLQIQETLIASFQNSQISSSSSSSLVLVPSSSTPSSSSSSQTVLELDSKTCSASETENSSEETSESSKSVIVVCEICAETKGVTHMFRNHNCNHSFCYDCVTKQVSTKIEECTMGVVSCPALDCKSVVEVEACRSWLPKDLTDKWDEALCEALFVAMPKFYCPFKDCSAMMVILENEEEGIMREAECPFCHRLFCASCSVAWHCGVSCEEFQSLNESEREREDLLLRELAEEKKWKRCPQCKFLVEKISGCLHITCRCKYEFCYGCGNQWTSTHGGCQRD